MYPYLIIADIGVTFCYSMSTQNKYAGVIISVTPCFRGSYCIVFNFDTERSRFTHAIDDVHTIDTI